MSDEDLPEGWAVVPLEVLVEHILGGDWGVDVSDRKPGWSRAKVIRGTDFKNWASQRGAKAPTRTIKDSSLQKRRLKPGDIVLEVSGGGPDQPVGRSLLVDESTLSGSSEPFVCSNFCRQVRLKSGVDSALVNLFLRWQYAQGGLDRFQNQTTNLRNLQVPELLAGMMVLLPPITEQKRITAKVEELLARVNAARERLARVPAILKRFRQAVLAAASEGRLTEDWRASHTNIEPAKAWLAKIVQERRLRRGPRVKGWKDAGEGLSIPFEIPETWAWCSWDDLVDWVTYGFTRPMPHVKAGVPIVTAKNISGSRIDFEGTDRTSAGAFRELSDKDRPQRGEILVTKDGSIGRAAVVTTREPFCINQSVAVLRFGGRTANVPYLLRVIEAPFTQALVDDGAKGSAIRHISITAFARFPVPVPPPAEQEEVVRRIEALFKFADTIEERVATAAARADKLTQSILAKAFRGELVPTEAELARRKT